MIRFLHFLFVLIAAANSLAFGVETQAQASLGSFDVQLEHPCQVGRVHSRTEISGDFATAGELTVAAFQKIVIPFKGSIEGIQSVLGTPESVDAIEIESESVFRIYGWCYEVDGLQPAVMPGEYALQSSMKSLRWFFGYARYREGNWEGYCETDLRFESYCKKQEAESLLE